MDQYRKLRHELNRSPVHAVWAWLSNRGLAAEDVFIASYPRSGNTWLRYLLYELITGKEAHFADFFSAIPMVGRHRSAPRLISDRGRLIKTHEPYRREYRRAVYLVRDVRDVVLSEFAFQIHRGLFQGDFEAFLNRFLLGQVNAYGFWADHVNSWLDAASAGRCAVLVVKYEDMRRDTEASLNRMVEFLSLPTVKDTSIVAENNNMENIGPKEQQPSSRRPRHNPDGLPYRRTGSVGEWRQTLTPRQILMLERAAGETLARVGYPLSTDRPEER